VLEEWHLEPGIVPAGEKILLGIEAVTIDAHRLAATAALGEARKLNIEVLPWAEVGWDYSFDLTSIDGKKLRSADLKGKVVLIDCWATWCSPCMALLPELKELYKKHHSQGLEVIGVNLDQRKETAQKAIARQELPWLQVWVPNDDKSRSLWHKARRHPGYSSRTAHRP
jgi:thiol-disulfide isomerase/thioredoxin